jgi:pilus assembly protein CpaB
MGRRTILLVVAALVAALGTSLVFLYVRSADARAASAYDNVRVLKAVEVIEPGETLRQAQQDGKIELSAVPRGQLLAGAMTSTEPAADSVALSTIYPNEQIVETKFGAAGDQRTLTIPDGKMAISVELTDPARVAGFVNPGADVAIFMNGEPELVDVKTGETRKLPEFTRMVLPRVQVIGVGETTVVPTTTTDDEGAQTTEQLPKTLLTLAVDQDQAERVLYSAENGELSFALLTEESEVDPGPGITYENLFS